MASNLSELSAGDIAAHVIRGELRAEDYAAQALERCRAQRYLNTVTWIDEAQVLEDARHIDDRRARGERLGALAGVPVIVKDNIDVAGAPTSAATPALRTHVAKTNAPVVASLVGADAVIFGKANMHELALGCTSSNPATGIVRNPYDPKRIPGGSSGGTAAAIAARIVPAGLGTDTAGSVRIPAALCGTAGLRPTTSGRKLYSDDGVVPLARSLDTVGPMARTVRDVALLHRTILEARTDEAPSLRGVRLGVPRRFYWENLQREVMEVAEDALARLRAAGAELVEVDVSAYHPLASEVYMTLIMHGLKDDLRDYIERAGHSFDDVLARVQSADVKTMFERAASADLPAAQLEKAKRRLREKVMPAYREVFRRNGLAALAFPCTPITAPLVREQGDRLDDIIEIEGLPCNAMLAVIRNTHVTAALGAPGLTIPAGLTQQGLPVGLELDGLPDQDDVLLGIGVALEGALESLPLPSVVR